MSRRAFNSADGEYFDYRVVWCEPTEYENTCGKRFEDMVLVEVENERGEFRYFPFAGVGAEKALRQAMLLPWSELLTRDSHSLFKYERRHSVLPKA